MRKFLVLLALAVAACGGNGSGPTVAPESFQHVPEILDLNISPESAAYMEGDGRVVVTAEIAFSDTGRDVVAMWVLRPDGSSIKFDLSSIGESGKFAADLTLPTDRIGAVGIEIWLVDGAGDSSIHHAVYFDVFNVDEESWTRRLSGFPYTLFDVVWNGSVFVAVGDRGAVLTSTDGISWVERNSGTDADLRAVAADGPYIVAVGFEIAPGERGVILQSTDNGARWDVRAHPEEAVLQAVAINSSRVVAGGYRFGWGTAITMMSEDRGESWQAVDSWPDEDLPMNDLVHRGGRFVASTTSGMQGAWVMVSADGRLWNQVLVSDDPFAVPQTILHDDSQFILAGSWGGVFTSPDGLNWTQLKTPVRDVFYAGAAWSGSRLMLAGASMCGGMFICFSSFDIPAGLSSTDGGVTWKAFNIDDAYSSWGLAWGNGRFVSVGERPTDDSRGAIYTLD